MIIASRLGETVRICLRTSSSQSTGLCSGLLQFHPLQLAWHISTNRSSTYKTLHGNVVYQSTQCRAEHEIIIWALGAGDGSDGHCTCHGIQAQFTCFEHDSKWITCASLKYPTQSRLHLSSNCSTDMLISEQSSEANQRDDVFLTVVVPCRNHVCIK